MPWLMEDDDAKVAGRRAERKTAGRLMGDLHPGSGTRRKGDMTVGEFKVENKATMAGSFSLELGILKKIKHEALHAGKTPALAVQFVDAEGRPRKEGAWVIVPEDVFAELIGREE
jgi:hypothetical protein